MVVLNLRCASLAQEPALRLRLFGDVGEHDLEGDFTAERNVLRLVNSTHPPFAEDAQDAVSSKSADLVRLLGWSEYRRIRFQ